MSERVRGKARGKFEHIDVGAYINGGIFKEAEYRAALRRENWARFQGQRVLVKACQTGPIPPWAFMLLLSHLIPYSKTVAYGEDCAPIVVFQRKVKA